MLTLAITAYNSGAFIEPVLKSIAAPIPSDIIRDRIAIDDHSSDNTREILRRYGWKVYYNSGGGVASAYNQILRLVKTEYFATFEHDIILNPSWFRIVTVYSKDPDLFCVQGVRLSTNKILRKIERAKGDFRNTRSLDNNLFKTANARRFRFPNKLKYASDRFLYEKVKETGFKWIVTDRVISDHIRASIKSEKDHNDFMMCLAEIPQTTDAPRDFIKIGLTNAVKVCTRAPEILPYYFYCSLRTVETAIKRRRLYLSRASQS